MKTILFIIASLLTSMSFAQVQNYQVNTDSTMACINMISIYIQNGPIADNGTVEFSWGDGISVTENFTVAANSLQVINITHSYANAGNYILETQVFSNELGAYVDAGTIDTIDVLGATDCGLAFFYVNTVSPYFPFQNVPLDFTDNTGFTQTITPLWQQYTGLNPANAPYTVSINDAWLTSNSLTQASADITITSFSVEGYATSTSLEFIVECNGNLSNPNFAFNHGFGSNFVAPLETGNLQLSICNTVCSNSSDVTVELTMENDFIPDLIGLTNASLVGNVLTFDILNLSGCEYILIPFTFPGATPAGTVIQFDVNLVSSADVDLSNNTGSFEVVILNSYDPNDKQVNYGTRLNPDETETLVYKVQFQNDGNYNAVNVKIRDIIDQNLDLSSLMLLESSHGVSLSVDEISREVLFAFNGIHLAPSEEDLAGSQGFVVFSLKENEGLTVGSTIENTAHIFFDFNPAIITNTTYNVNEYPAGLDKLSTSKISLYPNPAASIVKINGENISNVEVIDLAGKKIENVLWNEQSELNISTLTNGVYQVIVTSNEGVFTSKLMVQN